MVSLAQPNSLAKTAFWAVGLLAALLLSACGEVIRLDPTTDPRTFNGSWQGQALATANRAIVSDTSGQHLAILEDKTLIRIDPASGDELGRINIPASATQLRASWPSTLRLKPDGGIVILGESQVYQISASGVEQSPWNLKASQINHDGSRVLVQQNRQYSVWDTSTRTQLSSFTLPDEFFSDGSEVMFASRTLISPDLELFGVARMIKGFPNPHIEIELWNQQSRKVSTVSIHRDLFATAPFGIPELYLSTDNSRLLGLLMDGSAGVWRLSDGKLMGGFNRPNQSTLVGFAPNGLSAIFLQQSGEDTRYTLHFWSEQGGLFAQQSIQDIWTTHGNATAVGGSAVLVSSSGLLTRLEPGQTLWKKSPNPLPLSLNLKATYVDKYKYAFSGTVVLAGQTYQTSGEGEQSDYEFVSPQGLPRYLRVSGTLSSGQQAAFSLSGMYDPPTLFYKGQLTSSNTTLEFRISGPHPRLPHSSSIHATINPCAC